VKDLSAIVCPHPPLQRGRANYFSYKAFPGLDSSRATPVNALLYFVCCANRNQAFILCLSRRCGAPAAGASNRHTCLSHRDFFETASPFRTVPRNAPAPGDGKNARVDIERGVNIDSTSLRLLQD
jgi:hypothetical protein